MCLRDNKDAHQINFLQFNCKKGNQRREFHCDDIQSILTLENVFFSEDISSTILKHCKAIDDAF